MRILVDVDGVLANYLGRHFEIAQKVLGRELQFVYPEKWIVAEALNLNEEETKLVDAAVNTAGVALDLDPFPEAIESLNTLIADHDVMFVTAPLDDSPTWCYDRIQWLIKMFGKEQGSKYILTHQKYAVAGDVFIDDNMTNISLWKTAWPKGLPILWARQNNKIIPGVIRVNKWSRVLNLIDHFKPFTNLTAQYSESKIITP